MPNIEVKLMVPSPSLAQYSESCPNSLLFATFHLITHPPPYTLPSFFSKLSTSREDIILLVF